VTDDTAAPDFRTEWSLEGKVALITGAASGMGASHARLFVAAGARVVLTDVLEDEGRQIAAQLGEKASYLNLDVTDPDAWGAVTSRVAKELGAITVLVNNAGVPGPWAGVATMDVADYLRVIQVDQNGTFFGMRAVIPGMIVVGGGSIINISSVAGFIHTALNPNPAYTAAKFAVRGLTKAAAAQYGPQGVRANTVCPGGTFTPTFAGIRVEAIDTLTSNVPLRRLATSQEVSQLVLFLASDASSYVNGADYVIDGGLTAC
jgi:3alpha(or 20beta)-hydroxysteroid dehydrogenase